MSLGEQGTGLPLVPMNASQFLGRRRFLALSASVGAGAVLAACGGSGSKGNPVSGISGDLQVVKRYPEDALTPGKVRLPVSLGDKNGVIPVGGKVTVPDTMHASVVDAQSGKTIASGLVAERHDQDLNVPYWPFVADIPAAGIYLLRIDEAPGVDVSFQLMEDKYVAAPTVGRTLPPFDTPTVDDARGVDPICTRPDGACPFHDVTLTQALATGKPVVYMIGTPAFCTSGTCAPGLDALIAVSKSVGDSAVFVHADVYADKNGEKIAPAVSAYKLTYEPLLYVTDAKGTIVERIDAVFDEPELRSILAANGIS